MVEGYLIYKEKVEKKKRTIMNILNLRIHVFKYNYILITLAFNDSINVYSLNFNSIFMKNLNF